MFNHLPGLATKRTEITNLLLSIRAAIGHDDNEKVEEIRSSYETSVSWIMKRKNMDFTASSIRLCFSGCGNVTVQRSRGFLSTRQS